MISPTAPSPEKIKLIAQATLIELRRDKSLAAAILFGTGITLIAYLLGGVSAGESIRVSQNFGLAGLFAVLVLLGLYQGATLISRDRERQLPELILTKSVTRQEYYLGRTLGLIGGLAVAGAILGFLLLATTYLQSRELNLVLTAAIVVVILEASLLTTLASALSLRLGRLGGLIGAVILLLIGHSSSIVWAIAERASQPLSFIVKTAYFILPNLEKADLRNAVTSGVTLTTTSLVLSLGYLIFYTAALLALGAHQFETDEK